MAPKPDGARPRPLVWLPGWLTPRFLYLLGGIALLLACAPGLPVLFVVAIAGAVALAVATLLDLLWGPRYADLAVERVVADHLALRVKLELQYRVVNRSPRRVRVGLVETPVRTLEWGEDDTVVDVPPSSSAEVSRAVTPVARGADAFGTIFVWYENAIGLVRRRLTVAAARPFRVFPDLSAVERYGTLHVRNRTIEAGLRKMRLRGGGTEFESLREYAEGDAFRAIDWKATARRGKLMVAHHEVERSQNVMLVLDCGRLMTPRIAGKLRKFDYAVTAALSVAAIAGLASDRVGVVAFASEILAAAAPRSTRHRPPQSRISSTIWSRVSKSPTTRARSFTCARTSTSVRSYCFSPTSSIRFRRPRCWPSWGPSRATICSCASS